MARMVVVGLMECMFTLKATVAKYSDSGKNHQKNGSGIAPGQVPALPGKGDCPSMRTLELSDEGVSC